MIAIAVRVLGWLGAGAVSTVLSRLTAPYGVALDFELGGVISGIAGFALMYEWLTSETAAKKTFRAVTGIAAVVGLVTWQWYRTLLLSPSNPTPDPATEWLELALFCVAHAAIMAVLAFAYKSGTQLVLGKILRARPDSGA